jgi:outer membrane protein OmpA-like peptidoglycan-associated protein
MAIDTNIHSNIKPMRSTLSCSITMFQQVHSRRQFWMTLKFVLIISLLPTSPAFSQSQFREDFVTPDGKWRVANEKVKVSISEGVLTITTSANDPPQSFMHTVPASADQDFTLEGAVRLLAGAGSCGLRWGNEKDNYSFVINKEGQFSVSSMADDGSISIKDWTSAKNIKTTEYNKLAIVLKGTILNFEINNEVVYQSIPLSFTHFSVGFFAGSDCTAAFDYIEFNQTFLKTPEAPVTGREIFVKKDMGQNINSTESEQTVSVSADGSLMFLSRLRAGNDSDIFVSKRNTDGTWAKALPMNEWNNSGPNYVLAVSVDKNIVLLGNRYSKDGSAIVSEGVSFSKRTKNGWTRPAPLKMANLANRARYSYAAISPDGKTIVLSMQLQKERFDSDFYVSFLQPDSTWTRPALLPAEINTLANEAMATLAPDGRTLYYSTNGRGGYGYYDLFMSRRLDDTWMKWSAPVNLGKNINSGRSDMFIAVPSMESQAFLIMHTDKEKANIFSVTLPRSVAPEPVAIISGKVYDRKNMKPLDAEIEYENLSTAKEIGRIQTSPTDGSYTIAVPKGYKYGLRAKAKGYLPESMSLNLEKLEQDTEKKIDLFLVPIESGSVISLNNLFFDIDQYVIKPESYPELNRLKAFMTENPDVRIEISGHTDDTGNDEINQKLSLNRAEAAKNFILKDKRINPDRIAIQGYGKLKPVASNATDDGRQKNRRVELKIISL